MEKCLGEFNSCQEPARFKVARKASHNTQLIERGEELYTLVCAEHLAAALNCAGGLRIVEELHAKAC